MRRTPRLRKLNGHGLPEPKPVLRISYGDAHFIDETGAQVLGLHRFRREFGCIRDKGDGAVNGTNRIGKNGCQSPFLHEAELTFSEISADPFGVSNGKLVDGSRGLAMSPGSARRARMMPAEGAVRTAPRWIW